MQDHTKKGLEKVWSQQLAASRARREGSSAPTPADLAVYEEVLRSPVDKSTKPRALILGATPELRDLTAWLGYKTLAVDVSQPVLDAMRPQLEKPNHPDHEELCADWLTMRQALPAGAFDVILGDASLNNVPAASHPALLSDLCALLAPGGRLVTRHYVYYPERPRETLANWQRIYDQGKTHWLMFYFVLALYSDWVREVYDPQTKEVNVSHLFDLVTQARQAGIMSFREEDVWKVDNLITHGRSITHVVFPFSEFVALTKEHFDLEAVRAPANLIYGDLFPVFVFKAKS